MQTSQHPEQLTLTIAQVALLGFLSWLTLSYDTGARPDYNFRVLSLLWTLSFPVLFVVAGQVMLRRNRKHFAWGYSVLLLALLAAALGFGLLLLLAEPTLAAYDVAAGAEAVTTVYQHEAWYRMGLVVGIAKTLLLFGLGSSTLLSVLLVSRWANKRQGVSKLGAWLSPKMQVVCVCLLFSLGAAVQLYVYRSGLRAAVADYRLELHKHPLNSSLIGATRN